MSIWKTMPQYIFLTTEGVTFSPGAALDEPDVENCQVVGFASGSDAFDALSRLVARESWLMETGFDEVFAMQLASDDKWWFSLKKDVSGR